MTVNFRGQAPRNRRNRPLHLPRTPYSAATFLSCAVVAALTIRHIRGVPLVARRSAPVCRNIKALNNFEPPSTEDELRASVRPLPRRST